MGAGESGGEGEGNGEAVGHADYDVANGVGGAEMLLGMLVMGVGAAGVRMRHSLQLTNPGV